MKMQQLGHGRVWTYRRLSKHDTPTSQSTPRSSGFPVPSLACQFHLFPPLFLPFFLSPLPQFLPLSFIAHLHPSIDQNGYVSPSSPLESTPTSSIPPPLTTKPQLTTPQQHNLPRQRPHPQRAQHPAQPKGPHNLAHGSLSLRQVDDRRRTRAPAPARAQCLRLPSRRRQHPVRAEQGPGIQRERP